ncbi:hypothetical protein A1O1_07925 [Capronia coronata CBS 617.96]|uniref:Aminoglycoside phosphotransferase domain-containing protein n=1 Tax=Capronia coronata CBS 617.96 TaxID=1182541 RepID=W9XWZ9_9EURO|nr:uncharacterized protein A1O1_07925 [Capronia coronata CBS 617.96]EXJ81860.1 hypothetical protein A1O1_07925 [Capronia coronata CBS 617.96]
MAAVPPTDRPAGDDTLAQPDGYSFDQCIAEFFAKTSVTRPNCDARAKELVGGDVVPFDIQSTCSYAVYAGPKLEYIVQFRLKPVRLKVENAVLAKEVYGSLAPDVSFYEELGSEVDGKETIFPVVMTRAPGRTHLLVHGPPWNTQQRFDQRENLLTDMARFFALSWRQPATIEEGHRTSLRQTYLRELRILLTSLPERFHVLVQHCIDSMDAIFSLPMVFLNPDLRSGNLMVDEMSCHLTGVATGLRLGLPPSA